MDRMFSPPIALRDVCKRVPASGSWAIALPPATASKPTTTIASLVFIPPPISIDLCVVIYTQTSLTIQLLSSRIISPRSLCPRKREGTQKAQKNPFCVTRLQLLVFWTKFFGAHIPLLAEEGCPRHQKIGSVPICRGRGGQFGAPSKGQPN